MSQKNIIEAYFNATGIPFIYETTEAELMRLLDQEIDKRNPTIADLDDIFRDTAKMESVLHNMSKSGKVDKEVFERVAESYGETVVMFITSWFLNIRTLLRHGRIKNDNNFGFLTVNLQTENDKSFAVEENTELIIYAEAYFPQTFKKIGVKTTSVEVEDCIKRTKKTREAYQIYKQIKQAILRYTDQEVMEMGKSDQRFKDWCNDVMLFACYSFVLFDMQIECSPLDDSKIIDADKGCKQIAEQLEKEADHAEYLRLLLEKEVEEQEHKDKLAKAEEKRKKDEIKAKAKAKSKEASKRNIPPFPPNMREKGKQDSSMVCNKKAQLEWLKKHVPNWDGTLWNKKQANKYIDDIKNGIDVIICDTIPIAEACGACNDDYEGLIQAEASFCDFVKL